MGNAMGVSWIYDI